MPTQEEKRRGGVIRYRTIHPKGHPEEYIHIAIVRGRGPRGGRSVAGNVKRVRP